MREQKRKKLAEVKHSAMTRNIRERRDQSADDNLRVDLFFKLSNSGCALCHAVLSHTERKRKRHESEAAASSAAYLLLLFSRCRNNLEQKWTRSRRVGIKRSAEVKETPVRFPPKSSPRQEKKGDRKIKTLANGGGDARLPGALKKCHVFEPFGRGS